MNHVLDRPAWSALTTRHAHLAIGDAAALRYPADVVPFAAAADDAGLTALEALVEAGDEVMLIETDEIVVPEGLRTVTAAQGVQMVGVAVPPAIPDARIERLTAADAPDMLALAELTKPGPFTLRAQELGTFWGVRVDGRLVAMAGERMRQPGFSELSGVCAHPDCRGQGLAKLLSLHVAAQITARGEQPYLHAYAGNEAAIALYESIGFELRTRVNVASVTRKA